MIFYATTHDPSACCGCTACVQVCSYKAIRMEPDEEGFMYPVLNQSKCVHCGLCSRVCPAENPPDSVKMQALFAVMNRNEEVLKRSSSGGVFGLLADYVLGLNGCVIGCVWDEHNRPILKIAEKIDEFLPMQGSKYLSSDPNNVFAEVRRRLMKGQTVLFTGSPCQNAGLLKFLRKSYDKLITVDFLCHGMPSQKAFDAYIANLEKRYHGKVENFQFRDKTMRGWGLAESFIVRNRKKYSIGQTSPYIYGFIRGYFNRYSCYVCPFRGKRFTDFTIADYWGVTQYHAAFDAEKGVSAVSVNTEKAVELFSLLKDRCKAESTKAEWVAVENAAILHDNPETVPSLRKQIYPMLERNGWKCVERRYLKCRHRLLKRMWYMLPKEYSKAAKRLLKRG